MFKHIEVGPYGGEYDLERMLNDVSKSRELHDYRLVQFWLEEFEERSYYDNEPYTHKVLHTLWQESS